LTKKFQNKYRIESSRLQNWDYGWNGAYFVTICTQDKICYFGEINNCTTQFSEIGEIANKYWQDIPFHFPYVFLDAFVVMPNHVHGVLLKLIKKLMIMIAETRLIASLLTIQKKVEFAEI